jgi:hypothetical protein
MLRADLFTSISISIPLQIWEIQIFQMSRNSQPMPMHHNPEKLILWNPPDCKFITQHW